MCSRSRPSNPKSYLTTETSDRIQHTKERKPDVLKKVTDEQGHTFVLQIEFQVADEPEMVYRMAEYYVMLSRKYKLPVEQYVIFLGAAKPEMPVTLVKPYMQFHFHLIAFAELDYNLFLRSSKPEEIVLGVLGDFKGASSQQALERIIQRVEETTSGDFPLKRYFKQLRVLAQLRSLEKQLKELTMDSITKFVSVERDAAYMVGFDKGEEKIVANLLNKLNYSLEQIADIAGVSVDFVKSVKQKLAAKH